MHLSQHSLRQLDQAYLDSLREAEVERVMHAQGVQWLIHGYIHRPAIHDWRLEGQPARRAVLGDWQERQGSVLRCDAAGWRLEPLV